MDTRALSTFERAERHLNKTFRWALVTPYWVVMRGGDGPEAIEDLAPFVPYPTERAATQALTYWDHMDPGFRHVVYDVPDLGEPYGLVPGPG